MWNVRNIAFFPLGVSMQIFKNFDNAKSLGPNEICLMIFKWLCILDELMNGFSIDGAKMNFKAT